MPKRLGKAKHRELKEQFWKLDKSGDNKLNFAEMKALLLMGNPIFTDTELKALFLTIDTNNNGTVDFDEFVEFLYGVPRVWVSAPQVCLDKFTEFCGKEMDCTEFQKFCVDCRVISQNFRREDVATTFARVVPRGKRKIDTKLGVDGFSQYDKLLCLVAEKRECTIEFLHELISEGTITSTGTMADKVRLHDDKTTYTGAQSITGYGHKLAEAPPRPKAGDDYDIGEPGDWEPLRATYRAFQREGGGLTNREFAKLCEDSGLVHETRFLKGDADIIFAKLQQQKLNWEKFQEAVKLISERKKQQLEDIMLQIAQCSGPNLKCTQPDEVRLHDDKTTYTGTHA